MSKKYDNLLLIKGVNIADLESYTDRVVTVPELIIEEYTEIPKVFDGVSNWPKISNLRCWECDLIPQDYPKFIPRNPESFGGGFRCATLGHFCGWNCAVSYARKELPKDQQWDAIRAISLAENQFTGKLREKIMPTVPKVLMKPYCGKSGLTVQQWRDKVALLNANYSLTHYKLDHFREHD